MGANVIIWYKIWVRAFDGSAAKTFGLKIPRKYDDKLPRSL